MYAIIKKKSPLSNPLFRETRPPQGIQCIAGRIMVPFACVIEGLIVPNVEGPTYALMHRMSVGSMVPHYSGYWL